MGYDVVALSWYPGKNIGHSLGSYNSFESLGKDMLKRYNKMLINTYLLGDYPQIGKAVSDFAKKGLTLSLFFIGSSLSMDVLKQVGAKPFLLGVSLWVIISLGSLAYIL